MSSPSSCPVCNSEISEKNQFNGIDICGCGWASSAASPQKEKIDFKLIFKRVAIMSGIIVGLFAYYAQWDTFSLEIVPLKISQWTSMAGESELERIAEICQLRKKSSCQEEALVSLSEVRGKDLNVLSQLAPLQLANNHRKDALATFSKYFSLGGKDRQIALGYADALAKAGLVSAASGYYEYVLATKKLNVKAARSYIGMLVKNDDLRKARRQILKVRETSKAANYFMNKELKEINKRLAIAKI